MKYIFETPIHAEADKALDKIEPWFRDFCQLKRSRFEKNYHNSPARDAVAVGTDGITRKLQLSPFFSETGLFDGYLISTMAWRDKPRRKREIWWSTHRKIDSLPNTSEALVSLLEEAWKEVCQIASKDLNPVPEA